MFELSKCVFIAVSVSLFRGIHTDLDLTIAKHLAATFNKLRDSATDELYQGLPQQVRVLVLQLPIERV